MVGRFFKNFKNQWNSDAKVLITDYQKTLSAIGGKNKEKNDLAQTILKDIMVKFEEKSMDP